MSAAESGGPSISAIVPAFNAVETLAETIQSLLRQGGVEVIVVDDGSEDGTFDRAREIPGVNAVRLPVNQGPSAARNAGARAARCGWLVFVDADDEVHAGWREALSREMGARTAVISCGHVLRDVQSKEDTVRFPTSLGPAFGDTVASFVPGTYVVRASAFWAVGGFCEDLRYGEHHEMALRLLDHCRRSGLSAAVVGRPLVTKVHDRGEAVQRRYHRARFEACRLILEEHAQLIAHDDNFRTNYHAIAAYSAASLGLYGDARRLYLKAVWASPARLSLLARVVILCVPGIRDRVWRPHRG